MRPSHWQWQHKAAQSLVKRFEQCPLIYSTPLFLIFSTFYAFNYESTFADSIRTQDTGWLSQKSYHRIENLDDSITQLNRVSNIYWSTCWGFPWIGPKHVHINKVHIYVNRVNVTFWTDFEPYKHHHPAQRSTSNADWDLSNSDDGWLFLFPWGFNCNQYHIIKKIHDTKLY